jgi:hypothetical protein
MDNALNYLCIIIIFTVYLSKAFGGKAFANRRAHYVGNYSGAALWLPPDIYPDVDQLISLLQTTGSDEAKNDDPEI